MQEIVVISGKGGTGKTSITAAFAQLGGNGVVVADCDVDAANMYVLLEGELGTSRDFRSGYEAEIDLQKCTQCSRCIEVCQFHAITQDFVVDQIACEGCGYCSLVCPEQAITIKDSFTGKVYVSTTRFQNTLIHAQLEIGGENSGKLVSEVKQRAREIAIKSRCEVILIDGSPGIGCPVIASLTRSTFIVIVAEPSISGYNDMIRLITLISKFHIPRGVIINKSDLNIYYREKIVEFCMKEGLPILGEIPYHETFTRALAQKQTILEYSQNGISEKVIRSWNSIKNTIS